MRSKFNSIENCLRTTPYLFLKPNFTQNKPHLVNSLLILFAGKKLPFQYKINRGKFKASRIRPNTVINQQHLLKNLLEVKSLISIL